MRVLVLCLIAGAVTVAGGLLNGTAASVLTAVLVTGVVYAAWSIGHEQGWNARCELVDLQKILAGDDEGQAA